MAHLNGDDDIPVGAFLALTDPDETADSEHPLAPCYRCANHLAQVKVALMTNDRERAYTSLNKAMRSYVEISNALHRIQNEA
jgi:hypothetical protein